MNTETQASDYMQRADAWRSLAALFLFPAGGEATVRQRCADLYHALETLKHPSIPTSVELSVTAAATDYQALCVEFTRLFIGPFNTAAPPYGSFYLEEGKLMGESTIRVMQTYVSAGLTLDARFKDLPDHIAAECEFMYYLLVNLAELTEMSPRSVPDEIRAVYGSFVRTHLAEWVPQFCGTVIESSQLEYFRFLAILTDAFVAQEATNVSIAGALT